MNKKIQDFIQKYNAVIVADHMSNLGLDEEVNTTVCMDARYATSRKMKELLPDIVISFGGNIFSGIKEQLQKFRGDSGADKRDKLIAHGFGIVIFALKHKSPVGPIGKYHRQRPRKRRGDQMVYPKQSGEHIVEHII